jgi:hypothetical protein
LKMKYMKKGWMQKFILRIIRVDQAPKEERYEQRRTPNIYSYIYALP